MKLYYHHVGLPGATADFPKTVFTERTLALVEAHVPDAFPQKGAMLAHLGRQFPDGKYNSWGVPAGARAVINNLREGDAVLLVETNSEDGYIPALCVVRGYWPTQLPDLSRALWGSERFPFIFFFSTIPLSLKWGELLYLLAYAPNYDPRGRFLSVADEKLARYGGALGFTDFLCQHYAAEVPLKYSLATDPLKNLVREEPQEYRAVATEYDALLAESFEEAPQLQGDATRASVIQNRVARSTAFQVGVRRLYGFACAICGSKAFSPQGDPEVQSAHIFPKRLNGSDDLRNGVSLCRMHHWALDVGWMAFSDDRRILVKDNLPAPSDYDFIRAFSNEALREPTRRELAPHPIFLQAHRQLYSFDHGI